MKIKFLCLTCVLAALFCVRPAHAAVTMTLEQVDANTVVATGSGTLDVADLFDGGSAGIGPQISPAAGLLVEGNGESDDAYFLIPGPRNFGGGAGGFASTGTGDALGIGGSARSIFVPSGYVSGTPLSSTATWNNTTLAALGVTDGVYTWTWGSGADADSLTLYAGVPTPEPAPALLLTLGAAALALLSRTRDWRLCPKRRNVS